MPLIATLRIRSARGREEPASIHCAATLPMCELGPPCTLAPFAKTDKAVALDTG